jgi:hypothetical protein
MKDIQEFAQQVFVSQPFSRFIGAELTASTGDSAELSLTIQHHHLQQHGFVHGGVISYLADNAITFAGGLARILESARLPGCIFSKNQSRERRVEFMSISSLAMAK